MVITGSPYDLTIKVILLGDYSVGKTSLLKLLSRQSSQIIDLVDNSDAVTRASSVASSVTSSSASGRSSHCAVDRPPSRAAVVRTRLQPGGFVDVEFTHQNKRVLAKIADTGGQERYRSMTSSYYRGAHGCLLMFDVTKEETFDHLDAWIENMDLYKTSDPFPCILVGTRRNSPARRVPHERAAYFAEARGLPYMELDMDHMTDVRRVFETLLDSVTVSMNQRAPIAISIKPELSSREMHMQKKVVCSC